MAIRTLTVTLLDFGLAAAADCRIHIEVIRAGRDAGSLVIPTLREEVRTDETGVATFQVWPNDEHSRYQVKIYNARGSAAVKGYFDMPDADADLADIIVFEDEFSGTAATAELAKKLTMNSNWDVTANAGLPSAPRNNHAWRLVNVPATGQPVVDGKPVKTGQVVYRRDGQWHLLGGGGGFAIEDWAADAALPALPVGTTKETVLKVVSITGGVSFVLGGKTFAVGDLAVVLATTPSVSLLRVPATGMSAAEVAQAITDAVSAEATIRTTADAALQDEIDAEEQARADADTTLQNNINAEAATRASGDAATLASAQSYADGLVVGLLDDRGNYDASTNLFPTTGGSGAAGAVIKGDLWTISVAGVLGGKLVSVGDVIRALVDAPGQTAANWAQTENNLGYVPENSANKSTNLSSPDDTKFPTTKAVADALPYRGTYISLAALQAAVPAGNAGNYAYVDAGSGSSAYQYIWDANEGWVLVGLVPIADQTLLGNISGGVAAPVALTKTQVQTLLDIGWVLQTRTTAAPNATVPAHAHTATGAETNIDYVIRPKGTGALLAQVPDNTSTGGNKRGTRAVDLQRSRSAAAQVASGTDALIGAGTNNTASATRATVPNGTSCTASAADSFAGGESVVGSAQYNFSWGYSHSNAGYAATAIGYDHTIGSSGVGASALGLSHDLNGRGSSVLGVGGKDFGMSGLHIITGENSTSDVGRRQVVRVVLHKATTDATMGALTQGGGAVSNTNTFKYPITSQTYYIKGRVTARKSAATVQVKVWEVVAVIGDVGAGTVLLVDTITEIYESAGATSWALAANLDTGNGRFYYNVTGEAGVSIDWVADLDIHFGAIGV